MNQKARQRMNIISATLSLIGVQGIAGLQVSDIATQAGVSRQTVYNHFPDIGAVIEAALDAHGAAMAEHIRTIVGDAAGIEAKLAALAGFMVDIADPAHDALPLQAGLSAEARARMAHHDAAPREILATALKAETGKDAPMLTDFLWAQIEAGAAVAGRYPTDKPDVLETLLAALAASFETGMPE